MTTMLSPLVDDETPKLHKKRTTLLTKYVPRILAALIAEYAAPLVRGLRAIASFESAVRPILFGDSHITYTTDSNLFIVYGGTTIAIPIYGSMEYVSAGEGLVSYQNKMIIVWTFDGIRVAAK